MSMPMPIPLNPIAYRSIAPGPATPSTPIAHGRVCDLVNQLLWWLMYFCFLGSDLHEELSNFAIDLENDFSMYSALEKSKCLEQLEQKSEDFINNYLSGVVEVPVVDVKELFSPRSWDGDYHMGWGVYHSLDAFYNGFPS